MDKYEWEELCDGCGKCCGLIKRPGGVACPGLDTLTNRCTVYENRHQKELCLPVTPSNTMTLHRNGILPDSCAYVRYMQRKPLARDDTGRVIPVEGYANYISFRIAPSEIGRNYLKARNAVLGDPPTSRDHGSPEA